MDCVKVQDINELSNLYVMYSELCNLSYIKKDYKNVLKYYQKASKYFDALYSNLDGALTTPEQVAMLKNEVLALKKFVDISEKELGCKNLTEKINSDDLDKYEEILYRQKNKEIAYSRIAKLLYEDEAYVSAMNFFKASMRLNPEKYENYNFLGILYNKINDNHKAILCYEKYNEHLPGDPRIYNAIGELYSDLDNFDYFDKRIENFKEALKISPDYKDAIRNLALTYRNADNLEESTKYFNMLMKLDPTNVDYCDYAHVKLKNKDFKNGFKYFESRFDRGELSSWHPQITLPKLTKNIDFKDKTVLVHYEQGFGDTILFCRYLFGFNAKKIIFRVQEGLLNLLKMNFENVEIVGESTPIEALSFDYYIMLMNLPALLDATVDNIPLSEGYIKADEAKIEAYRKQFFDNDAFKIGISWQGTAKGQANRNIPLSSLYPLAKLKNVKVYSFQKECIEDLKNLPEGIKIVDLGKTFNDFSDTAAAIANVDLMISTDNVIANLAGAMGKKTFLLLFEDSDWRWFFDEEITLWYDSVKIFREKNKKVTLNSTIQNIIEILGF